MLDVNKVIKVYSGRQGCMCGCRGRYSYASAFQQQASVERGDAVEQDEVNDRSVKIIVGKLNRNPDTKIEDGMAWVSVGDRRLAAYFS